jgi:CXXX repeat radical SAM target protein
MEDKIKKEEILSRREFFKNAAKKALPIIAAVALINMPKIMNAEGTVAAGCDCFGSCEGGCTNCTGSCSGSCKDTCENTCKNTCKDTCDASSKTPGGRPA